MELRLMSTALLFHEDNVLLMKKETSRLTDQPFWSGLGGHIEAHEWNSPMKGCYREIYEESGITAADITDLRLRYILIRMKQDEIRQQFVYFGQTNSTQYVNSDEGELYWKHLNDLEELHMSKIIKGMLEHYQQHQDQSEIMIGTMTIDEAATPSIQWSELKDPIVF